MEIQFQYFYIQYHVDIHMMSIDILMEGMSNVDAGPRDDIRSRSIAREVINHHQHKSLICECVIVIILLGVIMAWFVHYKRTQ